LTTVFRLVNVGNMHPLIEYMVANGLSQADLAKRLGVHTSTLSYWLSGTNEPSRPNRIKIRQETGGAVTSDDLDDWAGREFDEAS
jgi:transcriptional regulator with XRE-family HTH domain